MSTSCSFAEVPFIFRLILCVPYFKWLRLASLQILATNESYSAKRLSYTASVYLVTVSRFHYITRC
uniref:Uncharacterized protein n=1 Tax=Anguilla anguilla TaxID=7936 RepID=A0A0E9RZT6_ANGAN